MPNFDYPHLLDLFPEHLSPKRSESAAFLIWYLENYYRLDDLEAVDAVCDKRGDKGVDGIFVNDNDKTITVFQGTISQSANRAIGDRALREFAGTLRQFESPESIQNLIDTAGNAAVAALAKRLDLVTKITNHELRGEFLSNIDIDVNGTAFLAATPQIRFIGKTVLNETYISDTRDLPVHTPAAFDIAGFNVTEYTVDANTKAIIAPVKATELVALDGIADQSLFFFNVRGPLGKTGVNKEIQASIRDAKFHKFFPLFHNGITVIAKELRADANAITISDYFVVNGCQSLTALYDNRGAITDNLRVLAKFIQLEPTSHWAKTVTEFSNNQNGVTDRDFMANDSMQIRLQNEFREHYENQYAFEIKRGEQRGLGEVITNEDAGLLLMSFDLKTPWATHRKYQVFKRQYNAIFGRKEVTADHIVMCHVIAEAVCDALPSLDNPLFAKYKLTKYLLVYIVRNILEKDALYPKMVAEPAAFVRDQDTRNRFRACIRSIVNDLVIDINAEVEEYGDDFDYRDKLRDDEWVTELSRTVVADYSKLVNRGRIQSFSDEWNASQ